MEYYWNEFATTFLVIDIPEDQPKPTGWHRINAFYDDENYRDRAVVVVTCNPYEIRVTLNALKRNIRNVVSKLGWRGNLFLYCTKNYNLGEELKELISGGGTALEPVDQSWLEHIPRAWLEKSHPGDEYVMGVMDV